MPTYGTPVPAGPRANPNRRYTDKLNALAALLWIIENQARAREIEYMGGAFKDDAGYGLTGLISTGDKGGVGGPDSTPEQNARMLGIMQQPGLVSLGHNHPGIAKDMSQAVVDQFSETDRDTGMGLHPVIPRKIDMGVVGLGRTSPGEGHQRILPPDDRPSQVLSNREGTMWKGYKGDEFLAEFPIDDQREYLMRKLLGRAAGDPRGLFRDAQPADVDSFKTSMAQRVTSSQMSPSIKTSILKILMMPKLGVPK